MTRDADTRQVTREQIAKALAAHWPAGMKRLRWTPEGWAKVLFATLPQPAPVADGEPRTRSGQAWLNDLHEPKGPCYDSPHCEHGAPILAIEAEAVGQNDANYRAGFRDGQCEAAQPAPGLDVERLARALGQAEREPILNGAGQVIGYNPATAEAIARAYEYEPSAAYAAAVAGEGEGEPNTHQCPMCHGEGRVRT
jgi:hypothetical protein